MRCHKSTHIWPPHEGTMNMNTTFNSSNLVEDYVEHGISSRIYRFGESNRGVLVTWDGRIQDAKKVILTEVAWPHGSCKWISIPLFPLICETAQQEFLTVDDVNAILDKAVRVLGGELEGGGKVTPETATPEQHSARLGESEIEEIVAQVIDQIGRDQIVEAVLSGKGGERFNEITESLTRKVLKLDERLSAEIGYLAVSARARKKMFDLLSGNEEHPLVQTGPGGSFTTLTLVCRDCEQTYYMGKHYQNRERCGRCLEKLAISQSSIDVDNAPDRTVDLRG